MEAVIFILKSIFEFWYNKVDPSSHPFICESCTDKFYSLVLPGHIIWGMANPEKSCSGCPTEVCPTPAVLYGRWGGRCPRVELWWALPIGTATCTSRWGWAQEPLWVSPTWSGPSPCCVLVSVSGACDPLWFRILPLCAILASPGW